MFTKFSDIFYDSEISLRELSKSPGVTIHFGRPQLRIIYFAHLSDRIQTIFLWLFGCFNENVLNENVHEWNSLYNTVF